MDIVEAVQSPGLVENMRWLTSHYDLAVELEPIIILYRVDLTHPLPNHIVHAGLLVEGRVHL